MHLSSGIDAVKALLELKPSFVSRVNQVPMARPPALIGLLAVFAMPSSQASDCPKPRRRPAQSVSLSPVELISQDRAR